MKRLADCEEVLPIVAKQIERWPRYEGLIVVMRYGKSSTFAELKWVRSAQLAAIGIDQSARSKKKSRIAGGLLYQKWKSLVVRQQLRGSDVLKGDRIMRGIADAGIAEGIIVGRCQNCCGP